ncbi:MAG: chromosomal replication initiator protein DnaA [Cyclobacteriaceae bacterium]
MSIGHQSVWNSCTDHIKKNVNEQSFKTWFEPITPIRLDKNILTIQVPSQFFYEWLEEHYVDILRNALYETLGVAGKLEYSVIVDKGEKNQPLSVKLPNNKKQTTKKEKELVPHNPFDLKKIDLQLFDSQLNPNYTFDTLIEGDCNRLARSAGMAVANKPGVTSFNPLMMYSNVGLGKTHLVQAIGNQIRAQHPDKLVIYVSSEKFANQIINAFKNNNLQEFANFYMQVDVLIIDDVQFLSGKEKTQEIFFHIFNHLHQSGKQVIMTSDRAPKELRGLEERLISRFKWGLTADLQQPDFETRMAIILKKTEADGIEIPHDVVEYLAHNVDTNIRELEGVIISLIAQASLNKKEIDLTLAKYTLKNIIQETDREVNIDYIQKFVCDYYNISLDLMKSKTRKREVVVARQVAMYFSKSYTDLSLKSIGYHFGKRDHSTVIHALTTVNDMMDTDTRFNGNIQEMQNKLSMKAS